MAETQSTAIRIRCPECDAGYSVAEAHLGKKVACPKCGTKFVAKQTVATQKVESPTTTSQPPINSSAEEPPAKATFFSWYKDHPGRWNVLLQLLAWLFYGYIWIPAWWLASVGHKWLAVGGAAVCFALLLALASVHRDGVRQDRVANNANAGDTQAEDSGSAGNRESVADTIRSSGPSGEFHPKDIEATAIWAGLRSRQVETARRLGNDLAVAEVESEIKAELDQLAGSDITWPLKVYRVGSAEIVLLGKVVRVMETGKEIPYRHLVIGQGDSSNKVSISIADETISAVARTLVAGERVEVHASIEECRLISTHRMTWIQVKLVNSRLIPR